MKILKLLFRSMTITSWYQIWHLKYVLAITRYWNDFSMNWIHEVNIVQFLDPKNMLKLLNKKA